MSDRIPGIVLLLLSALVILGMIVNQNHLWFFIDLLVIVGCGAIGLLLLRGK